MALDRKKILVLAPRLPYPKIGGDRLRLHGLCTVLSQHFDLTLLSLCEDEEQFQMPVPADGIFSRIERVRLPRHRSYLNTLLALPQSKPLQIAYYQSDEFATRLAELLPGHDLVFAHLIRTGDYVRHLNHPKVLEMTDAVALKYERVRESGAELGLMMSHVYSVEATRLKAYEKSIVADFDCSVLVSDVDKNYLLDGNGVDASRLLICSNGIDTNELPHQFAPDGRTIVFIGNMTSLQNLDGAWHFIHDILPLVRRELPEAGFKIVGRIDHADAARLESVDGVSVTRQVESIAEATRGASVGVCSIRFGAGIQNKVLEYMALGIPVVTSTIGYEGLEAIPGTDLVVADQPEAVAASCIDLLTRRDRAERLACAARRYVETRHDWQENLAPLVQRLHQILAQRSGRQA